MIGAGIAANAGGLRVREITDHDESVAVFLKRLEDFGELEALPRTLAGVHLSIVAPCGT